MSGHFDAGFAGHGFTAISFNGGPLGFQPTPTLGFTGAIFGAEALRAVAALLDAENAR